MSYASSEITEEERSAAMGSTRNSRLSVLFTAGHGRNAEIESLFQ